MKGGMQGGTREKSGVEGGKEECTINQDGEGQNGKKKGRMQEELEWRRIEE